MAVDILTEIWYNEYIRFYRYAPVIWAARRERTRVMDTLLKLLRSNARRSDEELAVMLGSTPEAVRAKIADYERQGIIKGYSVIIDGEKADKNAVTAFIEVKVTPKADCGFDELARSIMAYDEVDTVTLMSGSFDLAVTLSGTDYKEIALFVARRLSTIEGVISTSTHFVLKRYKEQGFFIADEADDERGFVSP